MYCYVPVKSFIALFWSAKYMDSSNFLEVSVGVLTIVAKSLPVLALLVVTGIFFYGFWRTGSSHFILLRMWRLAAGRTDVKDPILAQKLQELSDIEQTRFITGIRFATVSKANEAFEMFERLSISTPEAIASSKFFDPNKLEFIDPKYKLKKNIGVPVAIVFYLLFAFLAILAASGMAYLKVTKTDYSFLTNGNSAYLVEDWEKLTATECESEELANGYSHNDKVICDLLVNGKNKFDSYLASQRFLWAFLAALFAVGVVVILLLVKRASISNGAYEKYLKEKERSGSKNDTICWL